MTMHHSLHDLKILSICYYNALKSFVESWSLHQFCVGTFL